MLQAKLDELRELNALYQRERDISSHRLPGPMLPLERRIDVQLAFQNAAHEFVKRTGPRLYSDWYPLMEEIEVVVARHPNLKWTFGSWEF